MGDGADRWALRVDRLRWLGPGIAMAATAIGASHLVLAPTAGARFGYGLAWVVLFSHLFKYPAFEFGPRYAVATGTSLLEGYARVPGPRRWALWVFLAGTVVQGVTVLAGVLGVAAAVARVAVPIVPLAGWSLLLGLGIAWLLRSGGFSGLAGLSKWMLLALAIITTLAFLARPPSPELLDGLFVPRVPGGSVVLLAALVGWMPTGIDVAAWHSIWALERTESWEARASASTGRTATRAGTLAVARLDLHLGYGLSAVLAVMFLVLGAQVLRPAGLVPEGAEVAITLARLYTDTLGGWILPVFLSAAFFGMFSTAYGVLDGFPRAFSESVALLRPAAAERKRRLYWLFMLASLGLALLETLLLPDPVLLVSIAAVASFLIAPILFCLNHYCVTRLIEDPTLRPGVGLRTWSVVGIACAALATGLFLYLQLG